MNIINKLVHLIVFVSIVSFTTFTLSAADDKQHLPKGVYIHQLDNGMQVLLIENPALPMVGVNVVVKAGSAYENFSTSGMSHMLEHLLFNGTDSMTQKELYDATDMIGGYNNANTGDYYTNYMMVTPSENIIEGMKLQAAMLFKSIMPEDKFEKEKGIVMEEIAKSLGSAAEQEERNIISIIYEGHALSLPTLGTYETIKNMERDEVFDFYKNYYVPNNMIMSVVGNFNSDEMLKSINEIYGAEKPGIVYEDENSLWATGFQNINSINKNEGEFFHRFYKGEQLSANLIYKLPGKLSQEFFNLLEISLGNLKDSLQNILNEKYPEKVDKINFSIRTYPVINYLHVKLYLNNSNNISEIIKLFDKEFKNIDFGLSDEIINSEAVKTKTNFYKNVEKPHMFGIYNAATFAQYGIESVFKSYSKSAYIQSGRLLNEFSVNSEPIVIIQHPLTASETGKTESAVKTEVFTNDKNSPVIIAKQNSGTELLAIHYMLKNKAAYEDKFGKDASFIWHDSFGQRMDSEENKKESSKYGLTFTVNDNPFIPMDNIYLSPAFGYIRVEGLADDVKGIINYLNSQMKDFTPTEDEYSKAVKKLQGAMMMQKSNKAKDAFDELYQNIIYEPAKFSEDNDQVTYDNLLNFGKEYFTPQNMIISVVSPLQTGEVNNFFKEFKTDNGPIKIDEPAYQQHFASLTDAHTIEDTVGGEQSYLFYGFIKSVEEEDIPALNALSLLLSDKIIFDIREKQGMAYRMGAGINVIDDKALFNINLGTRPENVEKLVPQFPNFFTREYTSTFDEEELAKSINMYLGRMMFRRLSSINQAYYLAHSYYFDGDISYDDESFTKLKEVTIDDVKRIAQKYLEIKNPVQVIVH